MIFYFGLQICHRFNSEKNLSDNLQINIYVIFHFDPQIDQSIDTVVKNIYRLIFIKLFVPSPDSRDAKKTFSKRTRILRAEDFKL